MTDTVIDAGMIGMTTMTAMTNDGGNNRSSRNFLTNRPMHTVFDRRRCAALSYTHDRLEQLAF